MKVKDHTLKSGGRIQTGSGSPSSTRAERGTYLHLLHNITNIYSINKLKGGHFTIYIDNKQVIEHSELPSPEDGPSKSLLYDYDILQGINHYKTTLKNKYNLTIKMQHIYSHLDNTLKQQKIIKARGITTLQNHLQNTTAQDINKICDIEANLHYNDPSYLPLPYIKHQVYISYHNIPITTKNMSIIQTKHQEKNYIKYLIEKFNWTHKIINQIDWKTLEQYINQITLPQRVQYTKYLHKWRATQKRLHLTNSERCSSSECILCNTPEEDDNHPFHCTNSIMKDAQHKALSTLCKDLNSIKTYPVLTEAIIHYTKSWMTQENPTFIKKLLPNVPIHSLLATAIHQQKQDRMGSFCERKNN